MTSTVTLVGNLVRDPSSLPEHQFGCSVSPTTEWPRRCANSPGPGQHPMEVLTMTQPTRLCPHDLNGVECPDCTEVRLAALKVTEFWSCVDASGGPDACWPWLGYAEKGYGQFHWQGRMVGSHELAVTFTTGEARHPDLDTCHSCDNPICCNPAHLRFDTRQGNVDDAVRRGRHAHGERNGSSVLTEPDVVTIRLRASQGATGKKLAEEYGVSAGMVTAIVRGDRWRHAGGPIRKGHGNLIHGRYARTSSRRKP